MERHFLGWDKPALTLVVDWLLDRGESDGLADLSRWVVVAPGRRGQRRLLEQLAVRCEDRGLAFLPPTMVTVGRLPEQLYEPKRPFASDLTQTLAWTAALERVDPAVLRRAAPNHPTDRDRLRDLAELFRGQHRQLAADRLSFADVADHYAAQEIPREAARWRAMQQIQRRYLDILDELELWDIQTARLVAIKQRECATDKRLLLTGTADLNQALRSMLEQVRPRVVSLVFAPPEDAEGFDEFGSVRADYWIHRTLNVAMERTHLTNDPADQGRRTADVIAGYGGAYRAAEIVVGAADEQIVPQLRRELEVRGAATRWGPGEPLLETSPLRLLSAVAEYLQQPDYESLAELARHPDLDRLVRDEGVAPDWLSRWDEYFNQRLPSQLGEPWLGDAEEHQAVRRSCEILRRLLDPLQDGRRLLSQWREPIWALLSEVFGGRVADEEDPATRSTMAALKAVEEAFVEASQTPASLCPAMEAAQAVQWLVQYAAGLTVPPPPDESAIELLGWLELVMDDAPALILTSVNEGFLPTHANSDLFLPNALRAKLGMEDNDRRYARDAYAICNLTRSREQCDLIVARMDSDKNPLTVSRLLLAVDPAELPERVEYFFAESAEPESPPTDAAPFASRLAVPRPRKLEHPVRRLSVTRFRDYLACPYRFYLKHVLRLEAIDDQAQEMSPASFGTLLHQVLQSFGEGPEKDSRDADLIREVLENHLRLAATEQFGASPTPAVRIQIEQMRRRLSGFAEKQAAWAAQGWTIHAVEPDLTGSNAVPFPVDGEEFFLGGKVDRIDRHPDGRWAVFDYKSFDRKKTPEAKHRKKGEWIDLQLPLYRVLAAALGVKGNIQLGYILLPKDAKDSEFALAPWTEDDLLEAEELARDIIRKVRQEVFWPPSPEPPDYPDELVGVCQDNVWNRQLEGASP